MTLLFVYEWRCSLYQFSECRLVHTVLFRENFLLPLESSASLDYWVEESHLKQETLCQNKKCVPEVKKQTCCVFVVSV